MSELAAWVAPIATMIAAMMTAANLGARVTGWGFVVFLVGSICWTLIGISTGQSNLLWANGFLTVVNCVGIWRWLGRQAKYDDGAARAARRSAAASVPTLCAASSLVGATLIGADEATIGSVVDAMLTVDGGRLAYVVVSEGGTGGVGERLHALTPDELTLAHGAVTIALSAQALAARPVLEADRWPATLAPARPG